MYDDPFGEPALLGGSTAGVGVPLWVRIALWGPWALTLASILAATCAPGPATSTFFLVAAGSAVVGFGAVWLACVFKLVFRLIRGGQDCSHPST